MPSLYTDSLYTSLLLGLYDRSTSLTEVQINCVESGEPPWKTFAGTVGMRFEDSTVLPFDYQLYLIRTHFCLSTRTRKITRKNVTRNFWMVVYAHRNGPRLFNPVHVIELPPTRVRLTLSIYFKRGNPSCFLYFRPRLLYVTLFSLNFLRPDGGEASLFARQKNRDTA